MDTLETIGKLDGPGLLEPTEHYSKLPRPGTPSKGPRPNGYQLDVSSISLSTMTLGYRWMVIAHSQA